MPFHADNPRFAQRMQAGSSLIQFAMRRTPVEYYDRIARPNVHVLPATARAFTVAEYSQQHTYSEKTGAADLFWFGLNDVIPPLIAVTAHHPELSEEEALAIITNDETVVTYGFLASMTQTGLNRVYDEPEEYVTLSDDGTAIILKKPVRTSPGYGCEAVDARSGQPEMLPIFKKFVPWAGSLAVLAHFEYNKHC